MSKGELDIGTIVHFARACAVARVDSRVDSLEYRVEQRLKLACGATLYKIKSAVEPFDRVVSESDLALRS
jgi:hypothetical protein